MEDFNSIKNQNIKGQFVNKHVHACVTSVVEYILNNSFEDNNAPFSYDEIDNKSYFEDSDGNSYSQEEKIEKIEEWQQQLNDVESLLEEDEENFDLIKQQDKLLQSISDLEHTDEIYCEIYEWWLVSDWLAKKLELYSKVVIRDGMNAYWGRSTTGQAILLDYVITEICRDMEILEGQVNAWE